VARPRGEDDREDVVASRLRALVGRYGYAPCLLVSVSDGCIVEASQPAATVLGTRTADLRGKPFQSIAGPAWRSEPMRMLLGGTIDAYTSRSALRREGGELVPVAIRARRLDSARGRWIVVAFTPGHDVPGSRLLLDVDDGPTAIGFGDGDGSIAVISEDIREILGLGPEELRARNRGLVHADDLPDFLLAVSAVLATERARRLRVRLRHADGSWATVQATIASLPEHDDYRLAFVLRPDAPLDADRTERLTELEDRLRRIAVELAAVGVSEHVDPEVARKLGELTPRQQEVVRLLQDGARVPTISQELFLSQSTVRNHLSAIFRKFGVTSQEGLLRALRR
jgi:PAS domain S-box-containing protein